MESAPAMKNGDVNEISLLNANPNINLHLQKHGGHIGFPRRLFHNNNFYEMLITNQILQ